EVEAAHGCPMPGLVRWIVLQVGHALPPAAPTGTRWAPGVTEDDLTRPHIGLFGEDFTLPGVLPPVRGYGAGDDIAVSNDGSRTAGVRNDARDAWDAPADPTPPSAARRVLDELLGVSGGPSGSRSELHGVGMASDGRTASGFGDHGLLRVSLESGVEP